MKPHPPVFFHKCSFYSLAGHDESVTYGKHKQCTQQNPAKWVGSSAILCQKKAGGQRKLRKLRHGSIEEYRKLRSAPVA